MTDKAALHDAMSKARLFTFRLDRTMDAMFPLRRFTGMMGSSRSALAPSLPAFPWDEDSHV